MKRRRIEGLGVMATGNQSFHLRGKGEMGAVRDVVQRLHTESVTSDGQLPDSRVPNGECEDAVEARQDTSAPLLVAVQDHLGVSAGDEGVAPSRQVAAKRAVVVHLAVVRDRHAGLGGLHGHVPLGRQVENGQPTIPEPDAGRGVDVDATVIGPAVHQRIGHEAKRPTVDEAGDATNAAHIAFSPLPTPCEG